MDFTYGAMSEGPEEDRHVFIMIDGKEKRLTANEAERMAIDLITYAGDVRLGRSTNKEKIKQYCLKNGEADPFPELPCGCPGFDPRCHLTTCAQRTKDVS